MNPIHQVPLSEDADDPWEGSLDDRGSGFQGEAAHAGAEYKHIACEFLASHGARFLDHRSNVSALFVDALIIGANGQIIQVLAHGRPDDTKDAGFRRTDTVKKAGFDAVMLGRERDLPILLVTSHLPREGSAAAEHLARLGDDVLDVVASTGDLRGQQRLRRHLDETPIPGRLPAPWRTFDNQRQLDIFETASTEEPY